MSASQLIEGSRERVVKSSLNNSKSKQLWSFPKKKRFMKIKFQCPHSYYQSQKSTLNQHYPKFSSTKRKIFQDQPRPAPTDYQKNQIQVKGKGLTFGQSRQKCSFRSYIEQQPLSHPATTNYDKYGEQQRKRSSRGFTMRPKTAQSRNYFIDDKERQQVPAPNGYQTQIKHSKKGMLSKYKSASVGGIMIKSQRFATIGQSPGPTSYEPKKVNLKKNHFQCIMAKASRNSWIDRVNNKQLSPGPGDYSLPSEFGHYAKPSKSSRRFVTVE